jgi:hypothetical protein
MKNENSVSQDVLIREMGSTELVEYAMKLEHDGNYQKFMKKCIKCYFQLTGKNLLNVLNAEHA